MSKTITRYALLFVGLLAIQVVVLNNIRLGGYINPYVYILFIMLLPFEIPGWMLLLFGFVTGLTMDAFMGTLGMHSSATILIAFIRPFVLSNITTRDTAEKKGVPSLSITDIGFFIKYTLIIVAVHHFVLFYIEAFSFTHFFGTFLRVLLSTMVTSTFILLTQMFTISK